MAAPARLASASVSARPAATRPTRRLAARAAAEEPKTKPRVVRRGENQLGNLRPRGTQRGTLTGAAIESPALYKGLGAYAVGAAAVVGFFWFTTPSEPTPVEASTSEAMLVGTSAVGGSGAGIGSVGSAPDVRLAQCVASCVPGCEETVAMSGGVDSQALCASTCALECEGGAGKAQGAFNYAEMLDSEVTASGSLGRDSIMEATNQL